MKYKFCKYFGSPKICRLSEENTYLGKFVIRSQNNIFLIESKKFRRTIFQELMLNQAYVLRTEAIWIFVLRETTFSFSSNEEFYPLFHHEYNIFIFLSIINTNYLMTISKKKKHSHIQSKRHIRFLLWLEWDFQINYTTLCLET